MVVSEINILEFLTQTLRLPPEEAKTHVRSLVAAEEKLHKEMGERIDRKFEERKDTLATKEDVHKLELATKQNLQGLETQLQNTKLELVRLIGQVEVRMEQNTNRLTFWLVGTVFAALGMGLAAAKLLWP